MLKKYLSKHTADNHYRRYFKSLSVEWAKLPSLCNERQILQQYFKELTENQDLKVRVRQLHLSIQMTQQMFQQALFDEAAFLSMLDNHRVDFGFDMNPLNTVEAEEVEPSEASSVEIKICPYNPNFNMNQEFEQVYFFAK